jgi:hypothetical protein
MLKRIVILCIFIWFVMPLLLSTTTMASQNTEASASLLSGNRMFSSDRFLSETQIEVTIKVTNNDNSQSNVTIEEAFPKEWNILEISSGGIVSGSTITWTKTVFPGTEYLSYTVQSPVDPPYNALFNGNINSDSIKGSSQLFYSRLNLYHVKMYSFYKTLFTAVPLAMLLIHLCLYLFNRKLKENLYYALVLATVIISHYCRFERYPNWGAQNSLFYILDVHMILITFALLALFCSSLLYKKIPAPHKNLCIESIE